MRTAAAEGEVSGPANKWRKPGDTFHISVVVVVPEQERWSSTNMAMESNNAATKSRPICMYAICIYIRDTSSALKNDALDKVPDC